MRVEFKQCHLKIGDIEMVVEHPIIDALACGEYAFIIFDYSDFPPELQANNLSCYDNTGRSIWDAKTPMNIPSSAYTNFVSVEPDLVVGNFAGFEATINKGSGDVISSRFTK